MYINDYQDNINLVGTLSAIGTLTIAYFSARAFGKVTEFYNEDIAKIAKNTPYIEKIEKHISQISSNFTVVANNPYARQDEKLQEEVIKLGNELNKLIDDISKYTGRPFKTLNYCENDPPSKLIESTDSTIIDQSSDTVYQKSLET